MGHKSKADRQREAKERLANGAVNRNIERLNAAMQIFKDEGPTSYAQDSLRFAARALHSNWQILHEWRADGFLRAALRGGTGWVSGPDVGREGIINEFIQREVRRYERFMSKRNEHAIDWHSMGYDT